VAVYRLISTVVHHLRDDGSGSANVDAGKVEGGGDDVPISFYTLTQVLLRGVLVGVKGESVDRGQPLVEGMEVVRSEGGDVLVETDHVEGIGMEPNSTMRCYGGSCHCNSIRFRLRAPSHMFAKDCKGKIRYPHISTKADHFELLHGTESLSVYYVELPEDKHQQIVTNDVVNHSTLKGNIAAHTFCNRCGVHILRAPNPNSNELEVNTNCLNIFYDKCYNDESKIKQMIDLDVAADGNDDGRGLGSGKPLVDRLTTVIDDDAENEEDEEDTTSGQGYSSGEGPHWGDWPSQFTPQSYMDTNNNSSPHPYHQHQYNNIDRSPYKSTSSRTYVSTTSEDMSSTIRADDSINTSSSDGISPPPSTASELSFDNGGNNRNNTISPLNVGTTSSFRALAVSTPSPRRVDGSSPHGSNFALGGVQGSGGGNGGGDGGKPIALTQLKYYMKKHTPSVSDKENGNTVSSLVADE